MASLSSFDVYNLFCSSVLEGVLSAVEHHGGGEKTTGKKMCVCVREETKMQVFMLYVFQNKMRKVSKLRTFCCDLEKTPF